MKRLKISWSPLPSLKARSMLADKQDFKSDTMSTFFLLKTGEIWREPANVVETCVGPTEFCTYMTKEPFEGSTQPSFEMFKNMLRKGGVLIEDMAHQSGQDFGFYLDISSKRNPAHMFVCTCKLQSVECRVLADRLDAYILRHLKEAVESVALLLLFCDAPRYA